MILIISSLLLVTRSASTSGFPTKIHQARGSGDTSQADLLHAFRLLETQTSQQKHGAKGLQAKDKAVADAQRDNFLLIFVDLGVSKNGGTQQPWGFPAKNDHFGVFGIPPFKETPI